MQINKLEPSQRGKGRWLAWLDNGSLLRVTENEVADFALYAGMELSDEVYDKLTQAAGQSAVRAKALDYISSRPMSRRELIQKLTARPRDLKKTPAATEEQAQETADWLEGLGYLNDAEYADTVVQQYSAKGYGERKLRDELFRRGVPRQYWDNALEKAQPPEEGVDAFLRSRFKGHIPDEKECRRAADALARRGYSWSDISAGLRRWGAEAED